jgi:hypothetical protein
VELSWTYGFGAGPSSKVAAAEATDNGVTINATADVAMVSPASNLLGDVMKRPTYLPERVIARASTEAAGLGCSLVDYQTNPQNYDVVIAGIKGGQGTTGAASLSLYNIGAVGIPYNGLHDIYLGNQLVVSAANVTQIATPFEANVEVPPNSMVTAYAASVPSNGRCVELRWVILADYR